MKNIFVTFSIFVALTPSIISAQSICPMNSGTTVVYINGILAESEKKVDDDKKMYY